MMTRPPCQVDGVDCPRRHVGCRDDCKEWNDWTAIHAEEKAEILRGKTVGSDADSFLVGQNKRVNNDRRRKYQRRKRTRG